MKTIKEIEVNVTGITAYPKHLIDLSGRVSIQTAIKNYKNSKEWNLVEKPDYMYLEGWRFEDNERVCDAILGNIRLAINSHLFEGNKHADIKDPHKKQLMEDSFLVYLQSLTNDSQKLNEWIKSSLLYSAGCDYWYTYEKDWN